MKVFLFTLAVLVAGTNAALPRSQARFVDGMISNFIDDLIIDLQERGLDPLEVDSETYEYKLPVTDLLHAQALVENLLVNGISNIVTNNINFNLLLARLRFDISLPLISANIGSVNGKLDFANRRATAQVSGRLNLVEPRINGEVRVNALAIIGGNIEVTSISVNFRVADVQSYLNIVIQEENYSTIVNHILNGVIPGFLREFSSDVNQLLAHFLRDIINNIEL